MPGLHYVIYMECIRAPPKRGRYWEFHPQRPRDFLRPERFPEGEARGKSRGSREISRAEGTDFPFFHHYQGSIDFNTVNIHCTVGMYFLVSTGNRGDIEWHDLQRSYYPIHSLLTGVYDQVSNFLDKLANFPCPRTKILEFFLVSK